MPQGTLSLHPFPHSTSVKGGQCRSSPRNIIRKCSLMGPGSARQNQLAELMADRIPAQLYYSMRYAKPWPLTQLVIPSVSSLCQPVAVFPDVEGCWFIINNCCRCAISNQQYIYSPNSFLSFCSRSGSGQQRPLRIHSGKGIRYTQGESLSLRAANDVIAWRLVGPTLFLTPYQHSLF